MQEPPEESIPPAMPIQEPPKESTPNLFVCDCADFMRRACAHEGFYKEKEGKRYCVLHYPDNEKVGVPLVGRRAFEKKV